MLARISFRIKAKAKDLAFITKAEYISFMVMANAKNTLSSRTFQRLLPIYCFNFITRIYVGQK